MKTLKTKVILSAVVLLFALVATIGSTFAWFTVATTVQVQSMQLNVQSQDSLLIRLANNNGTIRSVTGDDNLFDATQYKTTLTTADILQYYFFDGRATAGGDPVPADAWRLEPVTVIQAGYASVNGKLMSTLSGNPNPTRALTSINTGSDINGDTGKVIQVSFYLFSQGETAREIVLQDLNVSTTMEAPANAVVNAVRLSAWRSGYYDLATTAFVSETTEPSYIFGFTRDYGFEFTNANPAYYASTPFYTGSESPYTLTGFNKLTDLIYAFSGTGSAAPDTATWTNLYYNTLTARDGGTTTKGDAQTILTLQKNVPTLVTVRVFVEGWSAATTNNIIASTFSISYKFSIKAL